MMTSPNKDSKQLNETEQLDNLTKTLLDKYSYILKSHQQNNTPTPETMMEEIVQYYENIIECLPGNIYWINKDCITVGCSKQVSDMFGLKTPVSFKGLTFKEMGIIGNWSDEATASFEKDTREVLATGVAKINVEEPPIPHSDGRVIYFLTSRVPLFDSKNNVIGIVGVSVDITHRKEMERDLNAAKIRAEEANRAKSEFLAVVSHELRIPLTGIIGMTQLLSIDCLLPGQKEQVDDILKASEHLLSLVNDLLDLTKLESGKMELHPSVTDLKSLVSDIANMMSFQASLKNLELIVNYEPDVPQYVIADARAIRQVLLNLIGNALKFTEKGYVVIKVKAIKIAEKHVVLEITIQDTGIGIAADKLEIIFNRFSQIDGTYSRRYGGTGLGLTLTKYFVELMGGRIDVVSQLGRGSTFKCEIPFPLQNEALEDSPWEPYAAKVRILIVDDTLRGEILLKHIGGSNVVAVKGKIALQTLLTAERYGDPYDIVMIDQQLITIDPLVLNQAITKQLTRSKPMLLLLMPPAPITIRQAMKAEGFFDCFIKPISPSELVVNLTAAWERWAENNQKKCAISPANDKVLMSPDILLIEDDLIVQKVHKTMLEKMGCKVDVAKNGEEALQMFVKGYDLIFMDIGLPGMSGLEITQKIRESESTAKYTPIVAMTAFVHEEDKNNCLAVGMDDVATKPISSEALKLLLEHYCGVKTIQE